MADSNKRQKTLQSTTGTEAPSSILESHALQKRTNLPGRTEGASSAEQQQGTAVVESSSIARQMVMMNPRTSNGASKTCTIELRTSYQPERETVKDPSSSQQRRTENEHVGNEYDDWAWRDCDPRNPTLLVGALYRSNLCSTNDCMSLFWLLLYYIVRFVVQIIGCHLLLHNLLHRFRVFGSYPRG